MADGAKVRRGIMTSTSMYESMSRISLSSSVPLFEIAITRPSIPIQLDRSSLRHNREGFSRMSAMEETCRMESEFANQITFKKKKSEWSLVSKAIQSEEFSCGSDHEQRQSEAIEYFGVSIS